MAMTTAAPVETLPLPTYHCDPTSSKIYRNISYFPREIIFNILIFIPAKPLFDAIRYVCKQWYDIVRDPDFVRAHCQMSTPGFLIQDIHRRHNNNNPTIHINDDAPTANHATEIQFPFPVEVLSCFNGFVLFSNPSNREIFHVANPVTKENISLPRLKDCLHNSVYDSKPGLAVDSFGHYKVVVYDSGASAMRVFTIGVDKAWRFIDHQGIPVNSAERHATTSYCPQSFGGFIYWFTRYTYTASISCGFAFDMDTETIYHFSQPKDVVKNSGLATFLSMGTSLGFILEQGLIWKRWKLTDVKSGEWIELADVNASKLCIRFKEVFDPYVNMLYYPVKLFGGQLWHFRDLKDGSALVRYNFVNGNMTIFPIKINLDHYSLLPHANTLVSLKNC